MGAPVVFDFSNGALSQRDKPTILTADDATVHSFSTQLNGPLADQQTVTHDVAEATLGGSVTPTESSAAAASPAGEGGGHTN